MNAYLLLEDGTVMTGKSFGGQKDAVGEIVFNTGMTGYEEILTDPSYKGQMVTMTYPLVGNYGINGIDVESDGVKVSGFIVKSLSDKPNHWQSKSTLDAYLAKHQVTGIKDIDTRMLTKKIRNQGTMNGIITTKVLDEAIKADLMAILKTYTFPKDVVAQVSVKAKQVYRPEASLDTGVHIALVDLGVKNGIIKNWLELGLTVTQLPYDTSATTLLDATYDIVFYSNGPGDPKEVTEAIASAKAVLGQKPVWGICLGHQIIALALGCDTYKMKFGHRGANHPIIEHDTGKVFISSQNHGYAVDPQTLPGHVRLTFSNVNDDSVEGLASEMYDTTCVQFHPEEGPGPEDVRFIFKKWYQQYLTQQER